MVQKKLVRARGKLQLSRFFQKLEKGDLVSIAKDCAVPSSFPIRLQGRTGLIEGVRGKTYIVKITEGAKEKRFLIEPIHLKKIKELKE